MLNVVSQQSIQEMSRKCLIKTVQEIGLLTREQRAFYFSSARGRNSRIHGWICLVYKSCLLVPVNKAVISLDVDAEWAPLQTVSCLLVFIGNFDLHCLQV